MCSASDQQLTSYAPFCVAIASASTSSVFPFWNSGHKSMKMTWQNFSITSSKRPIHLRHPAESGIGMILWIISRLQSRILYMNGYLKKWLVILKNWFCWICRNSPNSKNKDKDPPSIDQILSHLEAFRVTCQNISCKSPNCSCCLVKWCSKPRTCNIMLYVVS